MRRLKLTQRKFCETKLVCKTKSYLKPCKRSARVVAILGESLFFSRKDNKVCKAPMRAEK